MKIITSQKYQVMNDYLHIFGHLSCFLTLVSTLFYVDTDPLSRFFQFFIKDLCEKKRKNGPH
ncbi:hypothetical protein J2Y02_003424 [Neobacillus drentensis]|nr:hypothetical protein [Neobacillus drentensis]